MEAKWVFGIVLSLIILADCVPVEYVYTGDGCECPARLGYQINVPKLPKPKPVIPFNYGYKIDVPPMQAKAKVSYTFDFTVEEPRLPRPVKEPKLDLYAKVDRITMPKEDCPLPYAVPSAYAALPSYAAPPPPAPCRCGRCGISKPLYRYVNGKLVSNKCKCRNCKCPKCNCHLTTRRQTPMSDNEVKATGTPIVVASGRLVRRENSIRRKRDLRNWFFRPRRQNLGRSARYVKLYHKNLPKQTQRQQQQGWFDMDLFSEVNPFKRKTKKVFFPHTGSRIVKRDIKGEYDLLEKEREEADLTLPEIVQFMPETLQPNFKRGQCQFGCSSTTSPLTQQVTDVDEEVEKEFETVTSEPPVVAKQTIDFDDGTVETTVNDNIENDDSNAIDSTTITAPTLTKRNAAIYGYQQAAVPIPTLTPILQPSAYMQPPPILQPNAYMQPQGSYAAQIGATPPSQSPTNRNYDRPIPSPPSPCEQRKVYAAMRRAEEEAEEPRKYADQHAQNTGQQRYVEDPDQLRLMVTSSSTVPDPLVIGGAPLHYAGDLETPILGYSMESAAENPMVGATQYPVQHISSALLDRIITDIVYRHPEFIEASSHYGGALVDPEPYQEQQTKDFIKKLIDGRLSLLFGEPDDHFLHYYPASSYSRSYNPYVQPPPMAYLPAMY